MKTKNYQIEGFLESLQTLKKISFDGDISLAVVRLKKSLYDRLILTQEAEKNVIESFCLKDETGRPKTEMIDDNGVYRLSYSFDSPDTSKKCMEELSKIKNEEFELDNGAILPQRISSIKCSPEQMEALLLLTSQ